LRPSATPIGDRRCLVFSDRIPSESIAAFIKHMSGALKSPIVPLQAEGVAPYVAHDRLMARHQALVHRVLLTLAAQLGDEASRTFVGQRVCELADRIRAGDPVLYKLIQENKFADAEVKIFEAALDKFRLEP